VETRANHVLIGAFTVLVLGLAMLFALWIGKATLEREWDWYVVVFNEAISGLTVGSAVTYNGIQIGEVRELAIDPVDPSRVLATVRVSATAPVRTDTVAKLTFTGLTGVSVIQLSGGSPEAPRLRPAPDGSPPIIVAEGSALQKLLASSEDIATTASQVLVRLNNLLDADNAARVGNMLHNLEQTTQTIADSREDIRQLLAETARASRALNRTLERADQAFASFDGVVARFDDEVIGQLPEAVENLKSTLQRLENFASTADQVLEENRGALTSFGQQGLAQVGPALDELRSLLRDLRRMAREMEQSPARYLIRGQRAPEFEP
jgi:phospholipid/cholesterol/gamma-HCH transport system substrate-binding protein